MYTRLSVMQTVLFLSIYSSVLRTQLATQQAPQSPLRVWTWSGLADISLLTVRKPPSPPEALQVTIWNVTMPLKAWQS